MKGYNNDPLTERMINDVTPMRFNVLVRIHEELPETKLVLPDTATGYKESTEGHHGTIEAMGDKVKYSMTSEGRLEVGSHIIFDESISIDDPHRCFTCMGSLYVMFDVGSIICVLKPADTATIEKEIAAADGEGHPLCAIGQHLVWVLGDRLVVSRPRLDEQATEGGIIMPAGDWLQDVGGIKFTGGKYARHVGGVVEAAGLGEVVGLNLGMKALRDEKPLCERLSMDIASGDHILFPKYGHTDIVIDSIPCAVMKQDRVLATFKPKDRERGMYERRSETVEA